MKSVLERSALIFTIIASLLSILEYFGITFSKDSFAWLPNIINSAFLWVYDNVILFEANIWILLIITFAIYKLNIFIKTKANVSVNKEKKSKNLLKLFNDFDEDTQKVFGYIMYCQEKNINCTKQSINRGLKDTDISNLEQENIINNLINDNIIHPHYNIIEPTHYTLTKYGSDIAVALVKSSKGK